MGILVIFGALVPLWTNVLSLSLIVLQMKTDGVKLFEYQRVFQEIATRGIGMWDTVLANLVHCGIVALSVHLAVVVTPKSHCPLLPDSLETYCWSFFEEAPIKTKHLLFVACGAIMQGIRGAIDAAIPNFPSDVVLEQQKQHVQRLQLSRNFDRPAWEPNVRVEADGSDESRLDSILHDTFNMRDEEIEPRRFSTESTGSGM